MSDLSQIKEECGVTDISLHNAEILLKMNGCPTILFGVVKDGQHEFHVGWNDDPVGWTFTGFSWGYNGTGPNGLAKFLKDCGIDMGIAEIASMDQSKGFRID